MVRLCSLVGPNHVTPICLPLYFLSFCPSPFRVLDYLWKCGVCVSVWLVAVSDLPRGQHPHVPQHHRSALWYDCGTQWK